MTNENLDIVISNALCCSANKALELSDLLSQGNKCAESKLKELKVLNDSINELLCRGYKSNSIFQTYILCSNYDESLVNIPPAGRIYYVDVIVDGALVTHQVIADGIKTRWVLFLELFEEIPELLNQSISDCISDKGRDSYRIDQIETLCNVSYLQEYRRDDKGDKINIINFNLITSGECSSCLEQEYLDKLIKNVMATCDICECQLNQE